MKASNPLRRVVSWLLVLAMVLAYQVPINATDSDGLTLTQVDNSAVSTPIQPQNESVEEEAKQAQYAEDEIVRVSIVLEQKPTLEAGFSTQSIAENKDAMAWRTNLYNQQAAVTAQIEDTIGEDLDVCWNLTLAANMISANVEYGQVDEIANVPGVSEVVLEPRYEPQETTSSAADKPNMVVSANMTGASQVWESGYTGGGTRIAIVDTGLDTDHQSFDPQALEYALRENAKLTDMSYEDYLAHIHMLGVDEIAEKLPQLNVAKRVPDATADKLYVNIKSPFAFNYVDVDFDVTHDNDSASEHGSHVAGIAAANRYIKKGDEFVSAADAVGTLGNAPDAQIITMKVFGKNGGAYPSDYMAAIEDAIVLGCDTVNLSLGSSSPGFTTFDKYQELLDYLAQTDVVVTMAAGNAGYWAEHAAGAAPNLYVEDVNFQTAGSPATYANSLAVASVNNDGSVGASLRVDDQRFGYSEGTGTNNKPLASLDPNKEGTEYNYVFLESYGKEEDYEGIDVSGKIVFVSRGEINFADKADNAAKKGAVATVIYNDQLAGISMNLQGYLGEAPCVMITQAKGRIVKEHSTETATDAGVTYYTGKVTVSGELTANMEHSDFYSMSVFSSWGIPGDLSMKPEITAPGGNIYSVNGSVPETDQYELMSGTSMATPQVAGIGALLQQHIKEKNLSQEGLTDRALVQSLLMSTADPLKDANGRYYPIMQQGAGLVNILAATSADSYVLVNGQPDGKVKVELGDDPDRNGVYSFSFKLNNLAGEEKVFKLSADLFTQDTFETFASKEAMEANDTSKMATYLDNATTPLRADVQWSANGTLINSSDSLSACDFDGNGKVDEADAQALLDYVTGARASIEHLDHADVSGDQKVNTYDVHVMLAKLTDKAVVVPANGTVEVSVTMALTESEKERLDTTFTNGTYIQAYVYADAIADSEGVEGTCHSIPVLGFYGNWTDSSMFEVGLAQTHVSGQEVRDPYMGSDAVNSLTVEYARDTSHTYFLGGNPITPDPVYKPERNAFNNTNGDKIDALKFSPIRNVGASRLQVVNKTTGKTMRDELVGPITGPYYGVIMFMELWLEAMQKYSFRWIPKDASEGDVLEISMTLAPEYYVNDNEVNWEALGKGATLTIPLTIDNTAPKIEEVSLNLINNTLSVDASDNQYVAGIGLWNSTGTNLIAFTGSAADTEPGQTNRHTIDLSKANGSKFLVQVYDYAYNTTTYELKMDLGDVPTPPQLIAFDRAYDYYWTGFNTDASYGNLTIYSKSNVVFNAATIANHYVFACTDQGELYVMPETDLADTSRIRNLGVVLSDMAYDNKSETLYGLVYDEKETSTLYSINKVDGTLTKVGTVGLKTNTLACDGNGTFFCNEYGTSKVYSFTLDSIASPEFMVECKNDKKQSFETMGAQAMEYNPTTHQIVWTSHYFETYPWGQWTYSYLFEIDPEAKTFTLHDDLRHQLTALIIPQQDVGGDWMDPTDKVTSLELSHESMRLLKGMSARLTATVLPWTVTDRSVTWEIEDKDVAVITSDGLVTAVNPGTTKVTAVSKLDPSFTAEAEIKVETLPITVKGALQDDKGVSSTFSWNMATDDNWSADVQIDTDLLAATQNGKGMMYAATGNGATMKSVDMKTGDATTLGTWEQPMDDLAYSPVFSTEEQDRVHMVYSYMWVPAKDLSKPEDNQCWDLFKYMNEATGGTEFLAIASGGACVYTEKDGVEHNAELLYLLDNKGWICKLYAYADGDFYNAGLEFVPTNLLKTGYTTVFGDKDESPSSLVVGQDGNLYFSGWDGRTSVFYKMTPNEDGKAYDVEIFGKTGEDIWPAALLEVVSNEKAETEVPSYTTDVTLSDAAQKVQLSEAIAQHTQEEEPAPADLDAFETELHETTPEAPVGLNMQTESAAEAQSHSDAESVTVTVTAKNADGKEVSATNGLFTATYDPSKMALKSVKTNVKLSSTVNVDGSVTFGYADNITIPAGDPVATLVFSPKVEGSADVTITTTQVADTELEYTETVTVNMTDVCPSAHLTDVPMDEWYHEAVDYVVEHNIMEGTSATTFSPMGVATRGQMITVLYRMAGSPETQTNIPFTDVSADRFYAEAVAWAFENGITTGVTETRFAPGAFVTREQMVTFFARYAKYAGHDISSEDHVGRYLDSDRISTYAVPYMNWAIQKGLVVGVTTNHLAPDHTTNRAQLATILMRYCERFQ